MTDLKIVLVPKKGEQGGRYIDVNGERWGHIFSRGHGCHGLTYHFRDAGGVTLSTGPRDKEIYVRRERRSRFNPIMQDPRPSLDKLLLDKVKELISNGTLRPPSVIAKVREEFAARYAAAEQREQTERELIRTTLIRLAKGLPIIADDVDRHALRLAYREIFSAELPQ